MKKTIFLALASLSFATVTNAQSGDTKTTINFGLKAGVNLSNVYDTQGENFVAEGKAGFAGGGFVTIPLGSLFAIQPEIMFSQKGFKGDGRLLGSNYSYERTTSFVDIPLLFAIRPIKYLSIVAGPQYSFLLSEKNTFNSAIVNTLQEQEFKNDNIRKNILGVTAGADFNATDNVVIGLRAAWDLQQNNGDGTSNTPRYRNVLYQATLGIKF